MLSAQLLVEACLDNVEVAGCHA